MVSTPGRPDATSYSSPPLNTDPQYHRPSEDKVREAIRDLPDILLGMDTTTKYGNPPPPDPRDKMVLASELVEALGTKKGHSAPAAKHAINDLIQEKELLAEIARSRESEWTVGNDREGKELWDRIEGRAYRRHPDVFRTTFPSEPLHDGNGRVPYDCLIVRSTAALAARFATPSEPASGDPGPPPVGAAGGEGGKPKPDDKPNGPFDADGFRFAGVEVRFGRAVKQYRLVMALWDVKKKRPAEPRPIEEVITEVWGDEDETEDSTFRQMCSDTRRRFQAANCLLDIQQTNGKVQLSPL
jgi:hypothetical protein